MKGEKRGRGRGRLKMRCSSFSWREKEKGGWTANEGGERRNREEFFERERVTEALSVKDYRENPGSSNNDEEEEEEED